MPRNHYRIAAVTTSGFNLIARYLRERSRVSAHPGALEIVMLENRPGKVRTSATPSRHIPAEVRRRVWQRDGGRCAFIGARGRCTERGFLEFHHVRPFADGGESVVENLALRCRAHNAYEASRWGGTLFAREECAGWLGPDRVKHHGHAIFCDREAA